MGKTKPKRHIIRGPGGTEFVVKDEIPEILRLCARDGKTTSPLADIDEKCLDDIMHGENNEDISARQLASIGKFLRKAILKHRWNEAARLALLLCHPGIAIYQSTIINTCILLLLNHPNSSRELMERFIRKCTKYMDDGDLRKFIKVLFAIREEPLPAIARGKYVRQESLYKVIDEMCFKDL